jgi:streptomycin 6-kinase
VRVLARGTARVPGPQACRVGTAPGERTVVGVHGHGPGISPRLRRAIEDLGAEAARWLTDVPSLIAALTHDWNLEVGPAIDHGGSASILLPATTDLGVAAVLKLTVPHEEARHEADALEQWRGEGAVLVLRAVADGFALLLERCHPGHDLWTVPVDEQVEIIVDLLPRLWLIEPGGGVPDLTATAVRWYRHLHDHAAALDIPTEIAERARGWLVELGEDGPRRLLHGDLHPGNVLAAQRQPWLAIDPKPWVGDPAFDLAQLLLNWVRVDLAAAGAPVDVGTSRAIALADRLGLDPDRVLRWAVIKAIAWRSGRDEVILLDRAARTA